MTEGRAGSFFLRPGQLVTVEGVGVALRVPELPGWRGDVVLKGFTDCSACWHDGDGEEWAGQGSRWSFWETQWCSEDWREHSRSVEAGRAGIPKVGGRWYLRWAWEARIAPDQSSE